VRLPALSSDPLSTVEHDVRLQLLQVLVGFLVSFDEEILVSCIFYTLLDLLNRIRRIILDLELVFVVACVADQGYPKSSVLSFRRDLQHLLTQFPF